MGKAIKDPFGVVRKLDLDGRSFRIWSLPAVEETGLVEIERLPYSFRVLLEGLVRHAEEGFVTSEHIQALATRRGAAEGCEVPFLPARVLLQDLTGVPCIVDLAAMRSAMFRLGVDPQKVNPQVQVDLVIDHSLQVDVAGCPEALEQNMDLEFERNKERYQLFKWAQKQFRGLRVIPPGTGIVHQVNLERLASVVVVRDTETGLEAFPDTVVGTDSHTTMINGLGVVGWGVGGIEAEAVMLGQPYFTLVPRVVGVRLTGQLKPKVLATDLALTVTNVLRKFGVVGCFVEFFGPGVDTLSLPDRATVANMAPEYGATMGFFPVDAVALEYLLQTGRSAELVATVEGYCRAQRLLRTQYSPEPEYDAIVEIDLGEVQPVLAGPRRPQDTVALSSVASNFVHHFAPSSEETQPSKAGPPPKIADGAVAIAAITSCTNTSNTRAMVAAGLLAQKARRLGLRPPSWVKTSFTPGSRAVSAYLNLLGLLDDLAALGFNVAGYACATCIGNSGDLLPEAEEAVQKKAAVLVAVLSGNRNFEARVHPLVRANYLASPPLVVAYALAGSVLVDLSAEPVSTTPDGIPVYLEDLWPSDEELDEALSLVDWSRVYEEAWTIPEDLRWVRLDSPSGSLFPWNASSTYLQEPPFLAMGARHDLTIRSARILAILGDSVTTDHISPAGRIASDSPAALYLEARGVAPAEFNTYGSRRGNHEVMVRGTFANPRLRNAMAQGREGGYTTHYPSGELLTIFEASQRYQDEGVPLVIVAGKEYGTGSSRDWAAKGPALLGVRAVIAESFERIHRSNLVGMGILPLEFLPGENAASLGLRGDEILSIELEEPLSPRGQATVTVRGGSRCEPWSFSVRSRLDSAVDVEYFRHGGILPRVFKLLLGL